MRDDSFCIFMFFYESNKISGLKEWAELVAIQLTQVYLLFAIKIKYERISGWRIEFT